MTCCFRFNRPSGRWNDDSCNADKRYLCRRACPDLGVPTAAPTEGAKIDDELEVSTLLAILGGASGLVILLFGLIKHERMSIKNLNTKVQKIDESQAEYTVKRIESGDPSL